MKIQTTSTTLLKVLGEDATSSRWTEFAARYLPALEETLRRDFPSVEPDEIIQETLIALVKILPNYRYMPDEKGHFRNYLLGIVKNKAREHLRARQTYADRMADVQRQSALAGSPDAETRLREWQFSVYEVALQQLMADQTIQDRTKEIFRRVALNEESPDDVARLFGVSRNNVDQIKNRLTAKLRALVAELTHA